MEPWETEYRRLVDAEDYFRFFDVDYDPHVVSVNRLHILRKFGELCVAIEKEWPEQGSGGKKKEAYRTALLSAYETFLTRTAQDEKLFKVFRENHSGVNVAFHPEGLEKRS